MTDWQAKILAFCQHYNIPIDYLADILSEPKVVPMVRGKGFEFTVLMALQDILPSDEFVVTKTPMNTQLGDHDEDVAVLHIPTGIKLSVECKLAGKGTYRAYADGSSKISIKCMRSRTLGSSMVERLAPIWQVSKAQLAAHADSYLPKDFDVVVTTIGNAFYVTDSETQQFIWGPTELEERFLSRLKGDRDNLKDFAFLSLYIASSENLAVKSDNDNHCPRQRCSEPDNCGFIPNYPLMRFSADALKPDHPWLPISDAAAFLRALAQVKSNLK